MVQICAPGRTWHLPGESAGQTHGALNREDTVGSHRQVFRLRVVALTSANPQAFPSEPLQPQQWPLARAPVPQLGTTHHGGASAGESQARSKVQLAPDQNRSARDYHFLASVSALPAALCTAWSPHFPVRPYHRCLTHRRQRGTWRIRSDDITARRSCQEHKKRPITENEGAASYSASRRIGLCWEARHRIPSDRI